jgi:hypothetical protein
MAYAVIVSKIKRKKGPIKLRFTFPETTLIQFVNIDGIIINKKAKKI